MPFRPFLTALLILLLSAAASHAEPVSAIVTAIGAVLKAGGIAAALLKVAFVAAFNVGMGLIQQARAKKAQRKQESRGTTLSVQFGDTLPLSYIIGTKATAGRRYYAGTWGKAGKTPNAFATDCRVISCLPSNAGPQGLQEAWFGDTKGTILWDQPHPDGLGYPVKEFRSDSDIDYLWVKYYDGSQTTADAFLLEKFGAVEDHPYKPTMIGRGCQLVVFTCRVSGGFFPNGFPDALFVPKPMKLYDLRRDSTAGGIGLQRWDDPSTWESSDLLPVMMYNVARGIYYDGKWVHGGRNFAAHRLPASSWMAAINEADRAMEEGRKQFRGGLEVFVDEEPLDTLEDMRIGCAGRLAEVGGALKLLVGSPAGAVYSFTDANVVVTSDQDFEPFPSISATHNTITSDYPEPKERWAYKDAPQKSSPALVARDGGQVLPVPVRFEAVPFSAQVQSLMTAMIAEEQRWRLHNLHLPPDAIGLEPNDVLSWTSDKQSYITKRFIAVQVTRLTGSLVRVLMKEIDPNDYNPPSIIIPPVTGWVGPINAPPQPMFGWTVEPATVDDAAGFARRPAIKISCAADQDDVQKVHVQVRLKSTGSVVFDSDATGYAAPYSWLLSGGWTLSATLYQARGKFVPYSGRKTEFSDWIDVLTPDVRLTREELSQEIIDKLEELQEWIDVDLLDKVNQTIVDLNNAVTKIDQEEQNRISGAIEASTRFRGLLDQIESIRDYVANADYAGYTAREEIRRTITARLETSIASFDERITTAVSATSAISERLTTVSAEVGDLGSQILSVDTARVQGDAALAQQLSLLSVGTDNQFDPVNFWGFDSSLEGWTGNGVPTVAGGFLRPANHASDPYVVSPVGLAVNANAYSQIRGRVRQFGAPTWDGRAWWKQASDTTWDTARSVVLAAPLFDANGIGLITFNMSWTGTIDQIRIDLSTAQDAASYFTIDWISIGSPSPGASRAEMLAERTARVDADGALTQSIVALESEITDPVTGLTALAGGVSAIQSSVSTLGDTVAAQGTALTAVNAALPGKASVDSVGALEAQVQALGSEGILSNGSVVSGIRNSLLPLASEIVDQEFANFLSKMDGLKVTAEASSSLDTKIALTAESLDILSQAVTRVQAAIPGLATATAVSALTARVTAAEGSLTSVSTALNSVNASLPLKANTSDVNTALAEKASAAGLTALTGRVAQTENDISSQADALTSINSSLGTKASASALNTLTTRVTATENSLASVSTSLNSVNATLPLKANTSDVNAALSDKASASGLNSLTARVTQTENGLATKASVASVTAVEASVNEFSGDARFKMEVIAGPSGYARIAARVRYGTSGSYRTAGWYTDVPSNTAADTLFVIEADRFAFVDGTSRLAPFRIDDSKVFIDDLVVRTSNLQEGAITKVEISDFPATVSWTANDGNNITLTIDHGTNSGVIKIIGQLDAARAGSAAAPATLSLWDVTGGDKIRDTSFMTPAGFEFQSVAIFWSFRPPSNRSSTTFALRISGGTGSVRNRYLEATQLKR